MVQGLLSILMWVMDDGKFELIILKKIDFMVLNHLGQYASRSKR
jgi:hypothetical protein